MKAVFLIGATQRQFPVPISPSGILTDDDRSAAESVDFALGPATKQRLAERQYLAYIAFTRPSEFLCITYPAVDEKGGAVPRSQFIANLESLFEGLKEESIASQQGDIEKVRSDSELADLLCSRLGKDTSRDSSLVTRDSLEASGEQLVELLNGICSDEQLAELGSNVLCAVNYDNRARLNGDIVEKFFGQQIRSSATRLSTFAACPYQYFARYILELEEREEFKLEPLDLGIFYHSVLDALLKRINEEGKDFATIESRELLKILAEQIEKVIATNSFISNFKRHSPHNTYIISSAAGVLEDCVLAIAQMVRAGVFRPAISEIAFGQVEGARDTLGSYEISIPGSRMLSLDGKIDRLDIVDLDGDKAAIVFDYKRRDTSFSWSKFYYGLDMQLPIYMLAVRNATGAQTQNIAGAFYMPVETSPKQTTLDELSQKTDSFSYKAKGIFNGEYFQKLDSSVNSGWSKFYSFRVTSKKGQYGDPGRSAALTPDDFEKVLRFTEGKIVQLAEEIVSGKIDVWPYRIGTESPCSFCRYKPVCRFDWQINDYNPLVSLGKTEILEKIGTVDG